MTEKYGQHVTMAGNLHLVESVDIEHVTVRGDDINDDDRPVADPTMLFGGYTV